MSSSLLCDPSILTEGRTAGGGIARTWHTIQSGRENTGLNPINSTSSSLILRKILITISGVSFMESVPSLSASAALPAILVVVDSSKIPFTLSHSAYILPRPAFIVIRVGWRQPQPVSVSSPHLLILLAIRNTCDHLSSAGNVRNCLLALLLIRSALHLIQTQRKIFTIVPRYW